MANGFGPVDIVILVLAFSLSLAAGLWPVIKSKIHFLKRRQSSYDFTESQKKQNIEPTLEVEEPNEEVEFMSGGRKLSVLPVALSVVSTFLSSISLLGFPAEIYQRGLLIAVMTLTSPIALLVTGLFIFPVFYRRRTISIYEYFLHRFHSPFLRKFTSALFIIWSLFYAGIVLYGPAVSLGAVTKINSWPLFLASGIVCVIYTALGGLKAVVWADTLQTVLMYGGIFTLLIRGTTEAGGFNAVIEKVKDSGKLASLGYVNPTPLQHNSLWMSLLGGISVYIGLFGVNQMAIQRYCSLETLKQARQVLIIAVPGFAVLSILCGYIGMILIAFFHDRDPVEAGEIKAYDQLVILMMSKVLSPFPGLAGLFLACLFSGTLSTVSSCINSAAAVTWEDFLKTPFHNKLPERWTKRIMQLLVLAYGGLGICLAFAAGPSGGIISSALTFLGAFSGPLTGLFLLGIFVPRASQVGASIAILCSLTVTGWIALGSLAEHPYQEYRLPNPGSQYSTENTSSYELHFGNQSVFPLYRISNMSFPLVGIILVLLIGVPFSYLFPQRITEAELNGELVGQNLTFFKPKRRKLGETNSAIELDSKL